MAQEGYLDPHAIAPRIKGPQGADRGLIAGRSGSGKSVLARDLLSNYGPSAPPAYRGSIFIIDPNHNFKFSVKKTFKAPGEIKLGKEPSTYSYRPKAENRNAEDWNLVFRQLFLHKGPIITYIDELFALETLFMVRRLEGGNFFNAYLTQGRALGKAFLAAVQAPSSIPLHTLRQAEWFYQFDLPFREDRQRMAGVIGDAGQDGRKIVDREALGKFEFWFFGPPVRYPVRMIVVERK